MDQNAARLQRAERRAATMGEYRTLKKKVEKMKMDNPAREQEFIRDNLESLNNLYPIVRKKLDGAAADSKVMRLLFKACAEAANRINTETAPFELKRLILSSMRSETDPSQKKSLKDYFRFVANNFAKNSILVAPPFHYICGPIRGAPKAERKRSAPRARIVETEAVRAKTRKIVKDEEHEEEDVTSKEIEYICDQITQKAQAKPQGLSFFEAIVDPRSFTQTVENIFHISFLIKEGKFCLKRDRQSKPLVTLDDKPSDDSENDPEAATTTTSADDEQAGPSTSGRKREQPGKSDKTKNKESILSFTMEDYRSWIDKYNIRERAFEPRCH